MRSRILPLWHSLLRLPRQQPSWYRDRLREELRERRAATSPLRRLSETADVLYVLTRAAHDGHPLRSPPPSLPRGVVCAYMVAKYTSRWLFYRAAAAMAGRRAGVTMSQGVREVINPAKKSKVGEVATRHGLDRAEFERVCFQLRKFWPLLP
ncbi:hypothetical protein ISF_03108 [Cordyceps fumosorosea ARSEF 2679]|uniref:Uncharacterized protein n=1 Tax=Cordyceps fumosorosea (strain ARSEF 2679) TaxID=1081104 RepID=A0A168BA81_CORFA|nr:hypothetical protein ISF_03108 [Cordyceps fumosorosea ARSEF 2679]OAA69838.1 hypothetical protein ISF_03108 [Cordyceps fumosorosea ARSEF 2679]